MIFNYLKLTLKVLARNKFFTAISLFGISFTLAILMVVVAVLETEVGKTKPLTDKDKLVLISNLNLSRIYYDTIYQYDTSFVSDAIVIDTSYTLNEDGQSNTSNQFSHWFLKTYLDKVPNAINRSFFNSGQSFNAYVQNSKVELKATYTDHHFFEILDWEFVEGFGFGSANVEQEEHVAIITDELADQYFGRKNNVLDESIVMDGRTLRVMGVVKPAGVSLLSTNIIVPYTLLSDLSQQDGGPFGGFMPIFQASSPSEVSLIKNNIEFINSKTQVPAEFQDRFDIIEFKPASFYELYASALLEYEDLAKSLRIVQWILVILLGLFILLPTLNLINLNISRILERGSEIGVRKAFGANPFTLMTQFTIENIIQTFIGGIIGLGIAVIAVYLINDAKLLGSTVLRLNWRFFVFSFFICLLFGLVSGLLPAYRMSKMHVVDALKSK